ncbi:aminotransferase family protein [Siminovitchia fortis]|uniref:aminotransferase family protein n=1 Tax=Siminovitchia fortis TaxID=254758 RepID=UPI00119FD908|nr:aspartate aminotransferase family protein [Siminovitchia fortis]
MTNIVKENLSVEELIKIDKEHFIHPTTVPKDIIENGPKIIFSEGKGIRVKDVSGNEYIDGVSMLWNVNLGYGQEKLAKAAYEQLQTLPYCSSFYGYSNENAIRLAERVASVAPGDLNAVFFTSGGSESNESAFKLVRHYWDMKGHKEKKTIISLKRGYHGATISTGTATGIQGFHNFSGSKDADIIHAQPHLTNAELGDKSDPDYEGSIRNTIDKMGADKIAAVIMEPVQGAGGVHVAPEGYLQAVKKLCEEKNVLFIADEVICGFGRTGKMFGVENWDVEPDVMCVAKGITSGYAQLGAVLLSKEIRDTLVQYDQILGHGFTYSGHPTACAVGLATLDLLEEQNILQNVNAMSEELKKGFKYLEENHSHIANTRAVGLLAGFDLMQDPENGTPFEQSIRAARYVVDHCFDNRLILRAADFEHQVNIVAIAPPLIINKQEVEEIINIVDDALTAFEKTL